MIRVGISRDEFAIFHQIVLTRYLHLVLTTYIVNSFSYLPYFFLRIILKEYLPTRIKRYLFLDYRLNFEFSLRFVLLLKFSYLCDTEFCLNVRNELNEGICPTLFVQYLRVSHTRWYR